MDPKAAQSPSGRSFDGVLRRSVDITTRAIDPETRSVEVIASTDSIDSHGDILEQDWDLKRYKSNPVVLWHHNMFESSPFSMGGAVRPEDLLPIGKAENVRIRDGKLEARLVFASAELNPLADKIFRMFQEGMLRAVSVGFRPGKVTEENDPKTGKKVFRLGKNELREISAVPIPSNPDAVAKSIAWEREQLGHMRSIDTAQNKGPQPDTKENPPMTEEEQAQLRTELSEAKAAAAEARTRTQKLDAELRAQRERNDLLNQEARAAEHAVVEIEIEKLVGTKITPASRAKFTALAQEKGIHYVQELLADQEDLKLLAPVSVQNRPLSHVQLAAPPVEGSDGSSDILKSVNGKLGLTSRT